MDVLLLASGGLDSTTLAYKLQQEGKRVHPLFINYGQHFADTEKDTLFRVLPQQILERYSEVDVSSVYSASKSRMILPADLWSEEIKADDLYLPYRNLFLLTIAAITAQQKGIGEVYSAFINSNHAKEIDCSNEFFNAVEPVLKDFGAVIIKMPFRYLSKYDVAKLGIELHAPIGATFSCQAAPEIPCGACPNCVDRLDALRKL